MTKVIAIIDDEIDMEYLYSVMLQNQINNGRVKIEFFSDSRKFLGWWQDHTPDMILTDIHMPYFNGPQIIKMMGNSVRSIPTYFISGGHHSEYTHIMQELGTQRFISKPMDMAHVQSMIERDLGIPSANV